MRLSNHQKDAIYDIGPILVSRCMAPVYGESGRSYIFSSLVPVISTLERVFLHSNNNVLVFENIQFQIILKIKMSMFSQEMI